MIAPLIPFAIITVIATRATILITAPWSYANDSVVARLTRVAPSS